MNFKNARILVGRPNLSSLGKRPRLFVLSYRDIFDDFGVVYVAKAMIMGIIGINYTLHYCHLSSNQKLTSNLSQLLGTRREAGL